MCGVQGGRRCKYLISSLDVVSYQLLELRDDKVSFHIYSYHFTLHTCVVPTMIVPATLLQRHSVYHMGLNFRVTNLSRIADFHYIHSFYLRGCWVIHIILHRETIYLCK